MAKIENETLRRKTISMRLPQWIIDFLRKGQKEGHGIGELVEKALIHHYYLLNTSETKNTLRR